MDRQERFIRQMLLSSAFKQCEVETICDLLDHRYLSPKDRSGLIDHLKARINDAHQHRADAELRKAAYRADQ